MVEEGRFLEINGVFKWLRAFSGSINKTGGEISSKYYGFKSIYVDSKNLLHCLNGPAWYGAYDLYFIHGNEVTKEELDIYNNRILILGEI